MSSFWLRCDACNQRLNLATSENMELVIRFKPGRIHVDSNTRHPQQRLERCESCGWVSVFFPAGQKPAQNALLTPNWREVTLKRRA